MTDRLERIMRHWQALAAIMAVVATLVAIGVAWGTSTAQIVAESDKIAQVAAGQQRIEDKLDRIGTGLSTTAAAVDFDERDLAEVHQRLDRLESRR
jgi:DNA repair ATPase RecN